MIGFGFRWIGWEPFACRATSGPNTALSRECFTKNDGIRSRLMKLLSFLLSKFDVDPMHSVLLFLMYSARRGAPNSIVAGSLCFLSIGSTGKKNCLSVQIFDLPVSILN